MPRIQKISAIISFYSLPSSFFRFPLASCYGSMALPSADPQPPCRGSMALPSADPQPPCCGSVALPSAEP
ncbi:hypothetical protein GCWU000342_01569 [Shuttleworthella satelles DSM 14600]|uniref:Uncharacterized protein n=1 Tax=Shuttleworthella satelles DSM 14600 TaxID=626523 RepID=C4GC83_9FIRM|nr:hypothetical protein GCWU000342_01569 [Shuttleworthia satelles DSM 14600]